MLCTFFLQRIGMDAAQPSMWGFTSTGDLILTEFRYAKGHKSEMGEKELAFAVKFKEVLERLNLAVQFGLVEYPGDDCEGSCEITMGPANINLKPKDVRQPRSQFSSLTNLFSKFL